MQRNLITLALAMPALALAGCGGATNTSTAIENMGDTFADAGNAVENEYIDMTTTSGQDFADMMAASDAYEVEAGKLAAAKATSQGLKEFGAMMLIDHNKSTADLKAAAASATPAITPSATMTPEQSANLDTLREATGADFDSAYKSQQVAAHRKALDALKSYAVGGSVDPLKDFATKATPIVQGHLDKIEAM